MILITKNIMCGIYKIENLINGKKYIGKSIDIQKRFKTHINDSFNENKPSYNHLIHKAIRKYGVENFLFDIVEECKADELNQKEIDWIRYYDCCILDGEDKGYNMTRGGDGGQYIHIDEVYQLWDQGLAISEIAQLMQHDRHSISRILLQYDNYNKEESKKRQFNLIVKNQLAPIVQYDMNGNFIQKYNSISEASKCTGINYNTIYSNLRNDSQSAGGFQWVYANNNPPKRYTAKRSGDKKLVVQFTLQNEFVAEYESITKAAKAVGLSDLKSITICCKNPNRTAAGFYWRFKSDIFPGIS